MIIFSVLFSDQMYLKPKYQVIKLNKPDTELKFANAIEPNQQLFRQNVF